jgi:hypothetical protein
MICRERSFHTSNVNNYDFTILKIKKTNIDNLLNNKKSIAAMDTETMRVFNTKLRK